MTVQAALSEGGSALAKQQRAVEERARRLTAAENRAAMLEAEKADLQNELEAQMARSLLSSLLSLVGCSLLEFLLPWTFDTDIESPLGNFTWHPSWATAGTGTAFIH